jgi:AN1-type zinc finger protein 5/6
MLQVEIPPSTITVADFSSPTSATSSKRRNRCPCCNKKLGLIGFACKCGENFCAEHRMSESHNCGYNYQGEHKKRLETQLVRVVGEKIDKI